MKNLALSVVSIGLLGAAWIFYRSGTTSASPSPVSPALLSSETSSSKLGRDALAPRSPPGVEHPPSESELIPQPELSARASSIDEIEKAEWMRQYSGLPRSELTQMLKDLQAENSVLVEAEFSMAFSSGLYKSELTMGGRPEVLEKPPEAGIHRLRHEWTSQGWMRKRASLVPQAQPELFRRLRLAKWMEQRLLELK